MDEALKENIKYALATCSELISSDLSSDEVAKRAEKIRNIIIELATIIILNNIPSTPSRKK